MKIPRQATPYTVGLLVVTTAPTAGDRYAWGHFRHLNRGPGRHDDGQHRRADSLPGTPRTSYTTTLCKCITTTRPGAPRRSARECLHVSPRQTSIGGRPTWEAVVTGNADGTIGGRDLSLPTPSSDRTGLIPEPCPRARATRGLQEGFIHGGGHPMEAEKTSVASCRVAIPDMAETSSFTKEERQKLGQWAKPETADKYTRENGQRILVIQRRLFSDERTLKEHQQRNASEHLPDSAFPDKVVDTPQELPRPPKKSRTAAAAPSASTSRQPHPLPYVHAGPPGRSVPPGLQSGQQGNGPTPPPLQLRR